MEQTNSLVLYIGEYHRDSLHWSMYVYYDGNDVYRVIGSKSNGDTVHMRFLTRNALALWITSCIDTYSRCTVELRELDVSKIYSKNAIKDSILHYAYDERKLTYYYVYDQLNILRDSFICE